jgi:mono/diheme cytochrome c family protein
VKVLNPPTALIAAAIAASLAAAGCGKAESQADLVNGKKLFTGKGTCGSCHALARAGTKANVGPNLDDAFAGSRHDGFKQATIRGVVRDQIKNVRRGSQMPENLVKGDDARDVAAYVAAVAGVPGKDTGELATVGVAAGGKPIAAKGGTLTIPANKSGQLAYASNKATAPAGKVDISMPNPSPIQHNIALKPPGKGAGPIVPSKGDSKFTATLKPGKYEYYCQVPGHEAGGMKGTLTVK